MINKLTYSQCMPILYTAFFAKHGTSLNNIINKKVSYSIKTNVYRILFLNKRSMQETLTNIIHEGTYEK